MENASPKFGTVDRIPETRRWGKIHATKETYTNALNPRIVPSVPCLLECPLPRPCRVTQEVPKLHPLTVSLLVFWTFLDSFPVTL